MPKNLVSASQTEFQRGDGQLTAASQSPLLPITYPAGAGNGYVWTSDASGNGTWTAIPAGTTSAAGALQLDGTASDIQPAGAAAAAGSTGKAADAGHVHVGFALQATTTATGYTLVNGTGDIISWTAPNDGALHCFAIYCRIIVSSSLTGGQILVSMANVSLPNAVNGSGQYVLTASAGNGDYNIYKSYSSDYKSILGPGETVVLSQSSAATGGAAILYAQIWGS